MMTTYITIISLFFSLYYTTMAYFFSSGKQIRQKSQTTYAQINKTNRYTKNSHVIEVIFRKKMSWKTEKCAFLCNIFAESDFSTISLQYEEEVCLHIMFPNENEMKSLSYLCVLFCFRPLPKGKRFEWCNCVTFVSVTIFMKRMKTVGISLFSTTFLIVSAFERSNIMFFILLFIQNVMTYFLCECHIFQCKCSV